MNLAFFIARRTAQHTPDNKPGVMERIAVISVALSVAVMILAMAVIMGFKYEVARKVTAFAAHAVVTDVRGVGTLDSEPVRRSARTEGLIRSTRGFASMAPYAVKGGIVRTADAVGEVMLKGWIRPMTGRPSADGSSTGICPVWGIRSARRTSCFRAAWLTG